jgi:uncharacterized protein YdhG (YjbR/CyaY superfamily)
MKTMKTKPKDVASYIASFPPKTRKLLRQLRGLIRKHAPKADEGISYGMAGYKYHGMLVYFAGYEHHIGFYPGPGAIAAFKKEIKGFKTSKGTIQFPLGELLPVQVIADIVALRVRENEAKALKKKGKQ